MASVGEACKCTVGNFVQFLSAINVWIYKPHVINKRLICSIVKVLSSEDNGAQKLSRELVPKSTDHLIGNDTVIIDPLNREVHFIPDSLQTTEYCSYYFKHIECNHNTFKVFLLFQYPAMPSMATPTKTTPTYEGVVHPKKVWLETILLPKLCHWSDAPVTPASLREEIISIGRYCSLYKELKEKYGPSLIENWNESTDPYKFVYEDIAIATYLLVLWEEERRRCQLITKQSFIDLGCGNGLLVYILSAEGHTGKGIDLRARRIWDQLRPTATLEVSALTPSSATLFPDFDWLIGNHSDELTPWLPVIAARSSYNVRFFVLPCCSFDFDRKYSRPVCSKSQYRCYLDYVKEISTVMGFIVQEDTLRIPSSKRVCIIGQTRSYSIEDEEYIELKRHQFITDRTTVPATPSCHDDVWAEHFKPRPSIEAVKNCSTIDTKIQNDIVAMVTKAILDQTPRWIELKDKRMWNRGGIVSVHHVASTLLNEDTLFLLKNECGGLNTLLKNHCQIFEVRKGMIQLRDWSVVNVTTSLRHSNKSLQWKKRDNELLYKTKLCWYYSAHPQGCPRSSEECPYAHGDKEIRQRPIFNKTDCIDSNL